VADQHRNYDRSKLKIYAIGGSSIRDLPPDSDMERELEKRLGEQVVFRAFGNYSSSILDSMILAFALPRDGRTIFIHGLTANRFQTPGAMDINNVFKLIKIPLIWMYAWDELKQTPRFKVNYWELRLRNFRKLIQVYFGTRINAALRDALSLMREGKYEAVPERLALTFAPICHVRYILAPWTKMISMERLAVHFRTQEVESYNQNADVGYDIYENMVQLTGKSKHIFFLGPWSPIAREAYGDAGVDMCTRLTVMAEKHTNRVSVMDCEGEFFEEEEFHDPVHLNHEGREKVLDPLVGMLVKHINSFMSKKENNHD
jgi:hypothetical protein